MTDETGAVGQADEQRDAPPAWAPPVSPPSPGSEPTDVEAPSLGDRVREFASRLGFGDVDVPFDSPAEAARWWFAPIVDARTWRSFAASFAMAIIAPLLFAVTVTVLSLTAVAVLLIIGAILVIPACALVDASASVGRRLAQWSTGDPIPPREFSATSSGRLAPVTARLTDGARWRQVSFLLLDVVAAPIFLLGVVLPVAVLVDLVGSVGVDIDLPGVLDGVGVGIDLTPVGLALAVILLAPAARLVQAVAVLRHRYVAAFLGRDRRAALAERVEELSVQRDQVLEAVASERRRIERNLHDGVQQQIVALGIDIGRARTKIDDDPEAARALLDDARDKVRSSIGELRLIGRGLHPAVLEDRGLDAALSAVVAQAPIPIAVRVEPLADRSGRPQELPLDIAETAYYLANEAVTNVMKYSGARSASIRVGAERGLLPAVRITVHDDGHGGADETRGSGIAGMRARVEAVDGAFHLDSPVGGPTVVTAVLPLRRQRHDRGAIESSGGDSETEQR